MTGNLMQMRPLNLHPAKNKRVSGDKNLSILAKSTTHRSVYSGGNSAISQWKAWSSDLSIIAVADALLQEMARVYTQARSRLGA